MASQYDINDFNSQVLEKSNEIPVLVDFWAEWCQPCKMLGPILEDLATQYADKFVLAKVNTEEHTETAREYGIQSIPAVKLFIKGKVVSEFVGALPKQQIEKWLLENVPSEAAKELDNIKDQIQKGEVKGAEQRLNDFIINNPENTEARIILASFYVFTDTDKAIDLVKDVKEDSALFSTVDAMRKYHYFLSINKEDLPEDNPALNNILMTAIKHATANSFEDALSNLIEIVQTDKKYFNEIARKTCVALFILLGKDHEITLKYRRRFDMALY